MKLCPNCAKERNQPRYSGDNLDECPECDTPLESCEPSSQDKIPTGLFKLEEDQRPAGHAEPKLYGTFTCNGALRISDPSYNKSTWCTALLEKCKKGQWAVYGCEASLKAWGPRVTGLIAVHSKHELSSLWDNIRLVPASIGVDSGSCGIFPEESYEDEGNGNWMASSTLEYTAWMSGVVSSSGCGDSVYHACYATDAEGKVCGIIVIYVSGAEAAENDKAMKGRFPQERLEAQGGTK